MKMLMEIALPKTGELLVMMMMMISPSMREVPAAESLCPRAKVLLPKFQLEMAALRPERPLLIFFLGQNDLLKEICPRGNNKVVIYISYIMINVYYSC